MTNDENAQDRFNQVLVAIAEDMMAAIHDRWKDDAQWTDALLDVRYAPDGGTQLVKFRVRLPNGTLQSVRESANVTLLFQELWDLHDRTLAHGWYGVKFVVLPNGECQTEFDYDPNCINDPHFFDA
jgi:hypothetical protein